MKEPTEMELRVAKAIGAYYGLHGKKNVLKHVNVARKAIRAMHDPTDEMQNAGSSVIAEIHQCEIRGEDGGKRHLEEIPALRGSYRQEAREGWDAMIDAASPPTTDN